MKILFIALMTISFTTKAFFGPMWIVYWGDRPFDEETLEEIDYSKAENIKKYGVRKTVKNMTKHFNRRTGFGYLTFEFKESSPRNVSVEFDRSIFRLTHDVYKYFNAMYVYPTLVFNKYDIKNSRSVPNGAIEAAKVKIIHRDELYPLLEFLENR